MTQEAAFYEPTGPGRYRATNATVGPWAPTLQHAGPPAALLGHVLERLLVMVDSANGTSWEVPLGPYTFVPVDLNLVVRRSPLGEWVGMDATTEVEDDGLGLVRTRVFDRDGVLGASLHTLFVAPR